MEVVLRSNASLMLVEEEAANAKSITIDYLDKQLREARSLAVRADSETFSFEKMFLRVLGFGPLIDLPQKDIADVDRLLASIAVYPAQSRSLPKELAQRLRGDMNELMANSTQFAPLTADAASFIKTAVTALSLLCSLILIVTAVTLRRRTLFPFAAAI
jgi:hypothetical protein